MTPTILRKYLLPLILAICALDASAQFAFAPMPFFGQPKPRFGIGRIDVLLAPSPDESRDAAYESCLHKAIAALIRFDDFLSASTSAILPGSPIVPPVMPRAFPELPPLTRSPTTYSLGRNQCTRGYESGQAVTVPMPGFERLYTGLMKCERIYGREQIGRHLLCIGTLAERLDR
ncbi:hypothetical protein [Burkholderia pseudomultivorans]|uniref:Uncharacterized protein n=1 Tax=Burkholderia pseudomultivorans TaxID=1207504 RepID=A0A132EIV8_9BURK|nr:hypothetical protein [Burkholderia pseudomultivorans]KWF30788.1 hypothetical protein WT56_12265 [Burkholderia pseudomultivorans]